MLNAASGPLELGFMRPGNYIPGSCSDNRKLGMAYGSGGGAGPVGLGATEALSELGFLGRVDAHYTLSVSAFNTGGMLAGQPEVVVQGYEEMTEKNFIKKSRLYRIIDMRMLDRVTRKNLQVEEIVKSPAPLFVGVTQLTGGLKPISVNLKEEDPEHVVDWMMRGAHLGLLAGPAPRDKRTKVAYADGGFSHLSAVEMAVEDGCTDVIYIPNQSFARDVYHWLQVVSMGMGLNLYDPLAVRNFDKIVRRQIASRKPFCDGAFSYKGANVYAFYPKASEDLPTLLNMEKRKIAAGRALGKINVLDRIAKLFPVTQAAVA